MRRFFIAILMMSVSSLGACDVQVKSQEPSHVAEFTMATSDYPELMAAFDATAASFGLERLNAAPGLNELLGREVLFAAYEATDNEKRRGALDVTDVNGPGKVLVWVYEDGITDTARRSQFVTEVADIVHRFGGTLSKSDSSKQP